MQPRSGMPSDLPRLDAGALGCLVPFLVMFTGLHGTSDIVDGYETMLLIVSSFGVAATIPYPKKMIHGYNTCALHIMSFSAN